MNLFRSLLGPGRRHRAGVAMMLATLTIASALRATPPSAIAPVDNSSDASTQPTESPTGVRTVSGFLETLGRSGLLLGDMGGIRPLLGNAGMTLNIVETSELLGNATGGNTRGFEYDGLLQMILQVDTQRAFGLHGGTFNISGLQIHGRNVSADNLDVLQTVSGIEADRASRLWELWYQQKFLDEDRMDIKIGEQSLDQEFMVSQNALLFVNTMFGWPMLPSADLPGGGPAYPLAAPGVRLRARPTDAITVLAGVFNGSPVSRNNGDSQVQNSTGTSFPLNGGVLAIAEVQYAYPSLGTMVYEDEPQPLSGTYRLGAWYDSESFADQRIDNTGLPLASPNSSGIPARHGGNFGIYAVVDQMLWHSEDDPDHALSFFTRAMGTPQIDRNLIDFSLNIGLTLHDPIPHRDDDTLGIGIGIADVSNRAGQADADVRTFTGENYPRRTTETFIELTYQYQLFPWCQLQPDFQYIFNPGGGVNNPYAPTLRIKDEAVFGIRANILF